MVIYLVSYDLHLPVAFLACHTDIVPVSLAPACSHLLLLAPTCSHLLSRTLTDSPLLSLALTDSHGLSLALPCSPLLSLALSYSHLLSLALTCSHLLSPCTIALQLDLALLLSTDSSTLHLRSRWCYQQARHILLGSRPA